MGKGLFLLLLIVFAELYVMIAAGRIIGAFGVIALLVLSFLAGSYVIRREQAVSAEALRAGLSGGVSGSPAEALRKHSPERFMLNFFAGVLLIIPGFLSDLIALLLLLPPVQKGLSRNATAYMRKNMASGSGPFAGRVFRFGAWSGNGFRHEYGEEPFARRFEDDGSIIEGEARDITGNAENREAPALVIDLTAGDKGGKDSGGGSRS